MQVLCDSSSLSHACLQSHLELPPELPKTHLVSFPCQCEKCCQARETEPSCLEPCRCDGESQRCPRIVPDPIVVGGDHTKEIRTRSEVRVEGLTADSSVLPIVVAAFELVTESHFLRVDVTQSSVVDLQVARQRGKSQCIVGLV